MILMPKTASREIRLASRPRGLPTADNFTLAQVELAPPHDGQVLVRNLFMSVRAGKVKHKETVVEGIDQAVGAFIGLFEGNNVGTLVVKLA